MNKKLFFKKIIVVGLILSMFASLAGCGTSLDLTEEESQKIAEYAAGLLLKYDKNYSGSLVKVTEEEVEEATQGPEIVNEPVVIEPDPIPAPVEEPSDGKDKGKDKKAVEYSDEPLASFLHVDGYEINFNGIELTKSYIDDSENEFAFSFEADPGKELLLLHFNVVNNSASSALDLLSEDEKYRIKINGETTVNNLKTMLLNDLDQFNETVPTGEARDAVVVFQIPEGSGAEIQTIDFTVKNDGESATYKLF